VVSTVVLQTGTAAIAMSDEPAQQDEQFAVPTRTSSGRHR
jgi:hypothetical protein